MVLEWEHSSYYISFFVWWCLSSRYHTKYHKLGGLPATEIYFSQLWRQKNSRSRCWSIQCLVKTPFLVADDNLLAVSLHGGNNKLALWFLLVRALIPLKRVPISWLIISRRLHVLIPSHQIRFHHLNFG